MPAVSSGECSAMLHRRQSATDPELEATAWDLEPLRRRRGRGGRRAPADGGARRARGRSPSATRAAGRARRRGLRGGDARAGGDLRAGRPRRLLRGAALLDRHRRPATGALLQQVQERETAIETTLLFFELEWAALPDERAEELLAGAGPGLLPPPPAQRAPLPRAPAERARGEDPHREVAHGRERVGAAVRGADLGDRGELPGRRAETVALDVALSRLRWPRPRGAARDRRGGHRGARARACARARSCSTRCSPTRRSTTACAATPTGWRRATSPTRPATSRSQALIEAVRGRYELRAPLVPAEGAAARDRAPGRLRPHGGGDRGRGDLHLRAGARAGARLLRVASRPSSGSWRGRFFDERWIDAPVRPAKRGGAFCASARAVGRTRTCCSTTPRAGATC